MIFTTYKNHYKFGYDDINDFSFRENNYQKYTVEFGRASKVQTVKQASIDAARQIYRDADGDTIYISYSGGIDSEFIVYAFLEAGVPFEAIISRFKDGLNEYDYNYAEKFCRNHNVKLNVFDVDIKKFLETEMMDYAIATKVCSPQFPFHMHLWDAFDGFIVAGHELQFRRIAPGKDFFLKAQEKEDSVHRYNIWRNRNACPAFFFYTPELALSFILHSEMTKLFAFGKAFQTAYSGMESKARVYESCFDIEKRESCTGFEKIMDLDAKYRATLEDMFGTYYCTIPINELMNQLSPMYFLENKLIPEEPYDKAN